MPDVIALVATPTNDGIIRVPGVNESAAFAVATVNVGATGNIEVTSDTGGVGVSVDVVICESDPTTGACLQPASETVLTLITTDATPTFSVFVTARNDIPFDPTRSRIFLRFRGNNSITRGLRA